MGTHHKRTQPAAQKTYAGWEIEMKKIEYIGYARTVSYVMQGKSAAESGADWVTSAYHSVMGDAPTKPARIQSYLGGAFLRMYLDGKKDDEVIAEAGEEIGKSPEFKKLVEELTKYLQGKVDHSKQPPDPEALRKLADQHLNAIRKGKGIAFRYTLNPVIGGVTGVEVKSVKMESENLAETGKGHRYEVGINFADTYDFDNKRTGEYDRYRKELARYLQANNFDKFEATYSREAHHPFDEKMHKTHLDNAGLFASYMYALEQKKWTPGGLKWDVTVPAEITLTAPAAHHPAAAAHRAG